MAVYRCCITRVVQDQMHMTGAYPTHGFIAALALLAAPTAMADADEVAAPTANAEQDIIITAARTALPPSALPSTIDLLSRETLSEQLSLGGTVIDAVSTLVPSFSPTRQKLSGAGETLRGRSPLYAINGIPQSTPLRDDSRDGFTIDPFFIDRVELIYGSNALQGVGATGGVVNFVTVSPGEADGVQLRASARGTSSTGFEDDGFGGKAAGLVSWRAGAFALATGATYESQGAFYDGQGRRIAPDGTQGDVQDSRSWSVFGKASWQARASGALELLANHFRITVDNDYVAVPGNRTTGVPASAVPGTSPGDPPRNSVTTLALSYTDSDVLGGRLVSQLFYNRYEGVFGGGIFPDFQDPRIDPTRRLFDQSANRSRKLGGKASYERTVPGFDVLTVIAGFDALFDRTSQILVQTDRFWVPQTDYRSLAPFGQANLKLADGALRLSAGLRWENVRLTIPDYDTLFFYGPQRVRGGTPSFKDALINAGAVLEPIDGLRVYASYAQGYTLPDVGRVLRAVNRPNQDVGRLLNLTPVVADNLEFGAEYKSPAFDASLTYFQSNSDLGQLLVRTAGDFLEVQRQRIEIQGVELSGTLRPVNGLSVSAGYAHLLGRSDTNGDGSVDTDLDGNNIGPNRLNVALAFERGALGARLQWNHYFARRFEGLDPRNNFQGYALADLLLSYKLGFGTAKLGVQNLFDRQYLTYNSDVDRPADNLRFFAGRGRTVSLSYDMEF
jgi:iron complex outermembrane recepter protein